MGDGYELALRREALATIANILGEAIGTAADLRDSPISLAQVVVRHLSWMRERATQAEGERDKLRDLLRRVVNHRFYGGDIVFHYLEPGLRAEVDAAVGGK